MRTVTVVRSGVGVGLAGLLAAEAVAAVAIVWRQCAAPKQIATTANKQSFQKRIHHHDLGENIVKTSRTDLQASVRCR